MYICNVEEDNGTYKIVYCTPALYMAGGVERVLTLKANYFAEHFGYDITIILTEGKDKPLFYPLSEKVKVVNLDINFEELWSCSFLKKIFVYLPKQYKYRRLLTKQLKLIQPDITVTLLRREINFITSVHDGSKKVGELHINRANYRNFDKANSGFFKNLFSKLWMHNLVKKLKRLDRLVVLTEKDRDAWTELDNVVAIPNPLSFAPEAVSRLTDKRVIAVGRYCHEKGFDLLLQVWAKVQQVCSDWRLEIFGDGDRTAYEQLADSLQLDRSRCLLHGRTNDIQSEYLRSSVSVCSSRFEGFGLVIVEAMACGVPVVSFDCPWGPGSIIADGEDGILVENGQVEKMARVLTLLLGNTEEIRRLGDNAHKNVQRFGIDQIAERWKSLFNSL